MKQNLEDDA